MRVQSSGVEKDDQGDFEYINLAFVILDSADKDRLPLTLHTQAASENIPGLPGVPIDDDGFSGEDIISAFHRAATKAHTLAASENDYTVNDQNEGFGEVLRQDLLQSPAFLRSDLMSYMTAVAKIYISESEPQRLVDEGLIEEEREEAKEDDKKAERKIVGYLIDEDYMKQIVGQTKGELFHFMESCRYECRKEEGEGESETEEAISEKLLISYSDSENDLVGAVSSVGDQGGLKVDLSVALKAMAEEYHDTITQSLEEDEHAATDSNDHQVNGNTGADDTDDS